MLIKGRLDIIYKRGKYATVYDVKHSQWHVVDTFIRCPKGRMWSLGEFDTEADATRYCKWLWQEACNLTCVREAAIKAGEASDEDNN